MRRFWITAAVVAAALGLIAMPASAGPPVMDRGSFSFSGPDDEASLACGAPIVAEVRGTFSLLLRFRGDGTPLVTDHVTFHVTYTNLDTARYAHAHGSWTAHVVVGAGTDGRDVAKVTGLLGHVVAPGSGSSAQDSGQLVVEVYGPGDPDPVFVSAHGLFESQGGPFPELCEVLG